MKIQMILFTLLAVAMCAGSALAQQVALEFEMPSTMLIPGSMFSLDLAIQNDGPAMQNSQLFIALNVGTSDYWFYPSWVQYPPDVDSEPLAIAADSSSNLPVIPEFPWPDGTGNFSGVTFYGAVINNNELVSNLAQIEFGWTGMPQTFEPMSCNTDWVSSSFPEGYHTAGFNFKGIEGNTYYIWWDDLSSGGGDSTAEVRVSAFQEDKTTTYFQDVDQGFDTPQEIVIPEGESSVFVVITSQDAAGGSFKAGVTFFPYPPDVSVNTRQAAAWMTGDFDSYEQSQQQPAYYNITLQMKRIWPDRTDGYWLYVEQAVAGSLPYRQRVYKVWAASETETASEVYEFLNEIEMDEAVGAWAQEEPLSYLSPDDFVHREGCAVFLTRVDLENFMGGTQGKGCESDLNGASYATSEVTLTADQMKSWDRGYDSNDNQVWGAVLGPYIFDKKDNFDSELDLN